MRYASIAFASLFIFASSPAFSQIGEYKESQPQQAQPEQAQLEQARVPPSEQPNQSEQNVQTDQTTAPTQQTVEAPAQEVTAPTLSANKITTEDATLKPWQRQLIIIGIPLLLLAFIVLAVSIRNTVVIFNDGKELLLMLVTFASLPVAAVISMIVFGFGLEGGVINDNHKSENIIVPIAIIGIASLAFLYGCVRIVKQSIQNNNGGGLICASIIAKLLILVISVLLLVFSPLLLLTKYMEHRLEVTRLQVRGMALRGDDSGSDDKQMSIWTGRLVLYVLLGVFLVFLKLIDLSINGDHVKNKSVSK